MIRRPVEHRGRYLVRHDYRVVRLLAPLVLLVVWEGLARFGWVPVLFLPSSLGVLDEG